MAIKYLYIDDNLGHIVDGQVSALNLDKSELEVTHVQPKGDWEEERLYLLSEEFNKQIDGLIIDLRLDDENNEKGEKSHYKGTSLAQEIRTLSTENSIKEMPIALLSANEKINESLDNTGEHLFDIRVSKEKLAGEMFNVFRAKLIGLANGYKVITDSRSSGTPALFFTKLFNVQEETVDIRFFSKIADLAVKPAHSISSFVIKVLLESDGILICEQTLAARLGIDYLDSENWQELLKYFENARYEGVFHEGWRKWWSYGFESVCRTLFPEDFVLRNTSAEIRVEILKEKTGLKNLKMAVPLDYSQSSAFWTICQGTKKPIDPIDGLIIENQDNLFPWQEKKYVSIFEALNRTNKDNWGEVSAIEHDRLARLKKMYSRERIK